MKYQEVEQLKDQLKKYQIKISAPFNHQRKDLFFVELSIGYRSWNILIDDEYGDFSEDNPLMNWFLVLNALETYDECADILEWSNFHGIDTTNQLDYYKSLATTYREVETIIESIDPLISSFDYTLRTGVVHALAAINLEDN